MIVEVLVNGERAAQGVVGFDGTLVDLEWFNGWFGVDRIPYAELPILREQGVVFRSVHA